MSTGLQTGAGRSAGLPWRLYWPGALPALYFYYVVPPNQCYPAWVSLLPDHGFRADFALA